jgi:hypothetical protein
MFCMGALVAPLARSEQNGFFSIIRLFIATIYAFEQVSNVANSYLAYYILFLGFNQQKDKSASLAYGKYL